MIAARSRWNSGFTDRRARQRRPLAAVLLRGGFQGGSRTPTALSRECPPYLIMTKQQILAQIASVGLVPVVRAQSADEAMNCLLYTSPSPRD